MCVIVKLRVLTTSSSQLHLTASAYVTAYCEVGGLRHKVQSRLNVCVMTFTTRVNVSVEFISFSYQPALPFQR